MKSMVCPGSVKFPGWISRILLPGMLKPDVWYIMALHGTTGGSDMIIQLKWIEMVHEVHEQ